MARSNTELESIHEELFTTSQPDIPISAFSSPPPSDESSQSDHDVTSDLVLDVAFKHSMGLLIQEIYLATVQVAALTNIS